MKVVTAIDSFKGSMTSMEAGFAAAEGIHRVDADAEVQVRPLADGGEGTVEALVAGMNGKTEHVKVTGPLGEPVICEYGIIESTKTAVIEMAGAAGITQVPDEKRNPLYTTTYGVGEVIKDAIEKGCRRFIVGIGGSATNDGGVGMLQALGYAFLDKDGKQVLPGARGLKDITEITDAYVIPELAECKFRVACDVTNPLLSKTKISADITVFSYFQIVLLCFVIFVRIFLTSAVSCSLKMMTRLIRTTINLAPVFFMPQKPYKHWI